MAGLLGEIYSYGDRMKRKLGGLLSNPLENMALGATRVNEDYKDYFNLVGNAYPMPGERTVLNSPGQIETFRQLVGNSPMTAGMGMAGATMWQGPPKSIMTKEQAQKIVANEDYLPWAQVSEAKKLLGIAEDKASDIWSQMLAAKKK